VTWFDPLVDRLGYDPRSDYVETFWLGLLGPSATWLLRRVAASLERSPDGFSLALEPLAGALGIGGRNGRHVPLLRALDRCVTFGMVRVHDADDVAFRRKLPPLAQRHLQRLPESLRHEHRAWLETQRRQREHDIITRARQLALSLARLGEDATAIEAQLARWQVHPAAIHDATTWALARHLMADRTSRCATDEV
jgi:hypothetical protein